MGHIWGEPVIKKEATETAEGLQVRICERNETHVLEEVIPMLEKAQAAQPVVEAASEETAAEPEPEPVKPAVNKLDVVLGTTNTGMFFLFFFLVRSDHLVLRWDKRKKAALNKER